MSKTDQCKQLMDRLTDAVETEDDANVILNALSGVAASVIIADGDDGKRFIKCVRQDIRYIQQCQRRGGVEMEA